METPTPPRHIGFESDMVATRPRGLVRRSSKLQTHVEVFRCKLGKPAGVLPEADRGIVPSKTWTPIYYAVYHQREAALIHFLQTGGSPDDADGIGLSPLCIAVANGYLEIVNILLVSGADINAQTKPSGETALHIAIKQGRTDVIDVLLQHKPSLQVQTRDSGETPLHYAASKSGSLATVVSLLKLGSKYDTLNTKGQSPAEAALLANNIHAAVAIINSARGRRSILSKEKEMLLKHVEKNQNKFSIGNELIADIFSAACDPDSTVLIEAIKRNDAGLVEMFLEKGADADRPTTNGLPPIFVALECAKATVIQALVKHNANVTTRDSNGLTVLQAAFEGCNGQDKDAMSAIFDCLLSGGANAKVTYPDGKTLLHRAVSPAFGHTRVAYLLLQHGLKVNAQDQDGNTALHLATHSKACIDLLMRNGANQNISNLDGYTPLLYAMTNTKRASEPDFDTLIKASDLRKADSDGRTALHLAASNGLEKSVRVLLRARAETTAVDSEKNTPLLSATLNHQWHVVPLLTIPPSINSWDKDGLTALHHIASSIPKVSSSWKEVAAATTPFCQRGVSRSMRDRSGATPLMLAVKTLPEEGLPVIEALLMQTPEQRGGWNCVSHVDHKGRDALLFGATTGKPIFVEALLKHGATFTFEDWLPNRRQFKIPAAAEGQISKLIAQCEWSRRAGALRRHLASPKIEPQESSFATILPVQDLKNMIDMGLAPNALPKTSLGSSLLWAILKQIPLQPPLLPQYLFDAIKLILEHSADPNVSTARGGKCSPSPQASPQDLPLFLHTLTFLLEEYPTVDIDLIILLLTGGTKLSIASPFYGGRFPLHSAAKANRNDIVEEFLLQGADVNCVDREGHTPLFIAAEKGFWEIAETLLRRGAKVDTTDNEKNTVLHMAAIGGSRNVVATLLRAGTRASATNAKGKTPLACVKKDLEEKDKNRIVDMLQDCERREKQYDEQESRQHEANMRLRQEAEAKARAKKEHEDKEKQQKEKETAMKVQQKKIETASQVPSPLLDKPKTKSSLFKTPSLLSPRLKIAPPPSTSSTFQPKEMLELGIQTPASQPKLSQPSASAAPSPQPITKTVALPVSTILPQATAKFPAFEKPQLNIDKRVASPRTDSGFSQGQPSYIGTPLPVLDCNKATLSGDDASKRDSSAAELADWLALSKMMENM